MMFFSLTTNRKTQRFSRVTVCSFTYYRDSSGRNYKKQTEHSKNCGANSFLSFLEKDITLHQALQLLSDLVLKQYHVLTLAHVFIRWFVCEEEINKMRRSLCPWI